jgi:hypothetical protein
MTKVEFLNKVKALYRVGNASDSDSEAREDWTQPQMAGEACCKHLDAMLYAMLECDIITSEEHQELYDAL